MKERQSRPLHEARKLPFRAQSTTSTPNVTSSGFVPLAKIPFCMVRATGQKAEATKTQDPRAVIRLSYEKSNSLNLRSPSLSKKRLQPYTQRSRRRRSIMILLIRSSKKQNTHNNSKKPFLYPQSVPKDRLVDELQQKRRQLVAAAWTKYGSPHPIGPKYERTVLQRPCHPVTILRPHSPKIARVSDALATPITTTMLWPHSPHVAIALDTSHILPNNILVLL